MIFRKRICPVCSKPVTKRYTGRLSRVTYFCGRCQRMKRLVSKPPK